LQRRRGLLDAKQSLDQEELDELLELSEFERLTGELTRCPPEGQLDEKSLTLALRLLAPQLYETPSGFPACPAIVGAFYDQLALAAMIEGVGLVGLGIAFHMQLHPALELARRIKGHSGSAIPILIGGSQVSLLTEEQKRSLARLPYIDAVIVHEGEASLVEISRQIRDGSRPDFSMVPNAYFQCGEDSFKTRLRPPHPMSSLPCPAFDDEELKQYTKPSILPVYVSKGCYWGRCKFCDYTKLYTPDQAKATFRPFESVVDELEDLQREFGVSSFWLVSECISPSYYAKLAKAIVSRGLDIRMFSYSRVEKSYTADFFRLLHKAGVRGLTFGVEATNDRVLELIDKGNTVDDVRRTIRYASAAGICVTFNLIPDYPTISWSEVQQSVAFIRENIDFIGKLSPQFFDLSSNSIIAEEEEAHGLCVRRDRPVQTRHGYHSLSFIRRKGLSPDQVRRTQDVFTCLVGDIEVYRRSRDLLNLVRSDGFDWRKASFVLAPDMEVAEVHFDPSAPDHRGGDSMYTRLEHSVTVLSCPRSKSRLTGTHVIRAILETSDSLRLFSLSDVVRQMRAEWDGKETDRHWSLIERSLDAMVATGLVERIMHPWIDSPTRIGFSGARWSSRRFRSSTTSSAQTAAPGASAGSSQTVNS
jgi:radical SAM superfamily enzyme YgiQ (UPF0313 family)